MGRQAADIWAYQHPSVPTPHLGRSCLAVNEAKRLRHSDCSLLRREEPTIQRNEAMTDMVLVFYCPYCSVGADFWEMTGYKDGRFVCRNCAHTLRPGNPTYLCTCPKCLKSCRSLLVLFS
jgi:hypothetical protein